MTKIKNLIKKILGKKIFGKISPIWHGTRGFIASFWFGRSGQKMNLIGITGTKGKTSTTILTGRLLNELGYKTGFLSTALTFDGVKETQNPTHMSTIDPWKLQEFLEKCHKNGCQNMVLELSSQGLEQNRHWGIGNLRIAVFLNIYPEHIQAHGSWENYRIAKSKIFKLLKKNGTAIINGEAKMHKNSQFMLQKAKKAKQIETGEINKIEINQEVWQIKNDTNADSFYKTLLLDSSFLNINSQNKENMAKLDTKSIDLNAQNIENNDNNLEEFSENLSQISNSILAIPTNFVAEYEVKNLVYAIFVCQSLILENLSKKLTQIIPKTLNGNLPGRMEWIVKDNELIIKK